MGPLAAKSFPGQAVVQAAPTETHPAARVTQEIDYGRRGKGYVFGALCPATGEALTKSYSGRTLTNWIDFLEALEAWIAPGIARIYAIVDKLNMHRATDVLLFSLAHPRWEFVFQPKYAAYLNLIEPWWKTLRSLALKGRRFESWAEVCEAVRQATAYWNAHRHPLIWGRRRRHRQRQYTGAPVLRVVYRRPSCLTRQPGIAVLPKAA